MLARALTHHMLLRLLTLHLCNENPSLPNKKRKVVDSEAVSHQAQCDLTSVAGLSSHKVQLGLLSTRTTTDKLIVL